MYIHRYEPKPADNKIPRELTNGWLALAREERGYVIYYTPFLQWIWIADGQTFLLSPKIQATVLCLIWNQLNPQDPATEKCLKSLGHKFYKWIHNKDTITFKDAYRLKRLTDKISKPTQPTNDQYALAAYLLGLEKTNPSLNLSKAAEAKLIERKGLHPDWRHPKQQKPTPPATYGEGADDEVT